MQRVKEIPGLFPLLAGRAVSTITSDDYVRWAERLLVLNIDTPHLRQLAGLSLPAQREDADRLLAAILTELGVSEPDPDDLIRAYVFETTIQIIEGQLPLQTGRERMVAIWQALQHPDWLGAWQFVDDAADILNAAKETLHDIATLEAIESKKEERVRALSIQNVDSYVNGLLGDKQSVVDFDALMAQGVLFCKSGHDRVDTVVVKSLMWQSNTRSLEIASALLCGLWEGSFRAHSIDSRTLEAYIKIRRETRMSPEVEYASLLALCAALESGKLPLGTARTLVDHLQDLIKQQRDPAFAQLASDGIQRALSHSNPVLIGHMSYNLFL